MWEIVSELLTAVLERRSWTAVVLSGVGMAIAVIIVIAVTS